MSYCGSNLPSSLIELFVARVAADGEEPALLTHNGEQFVASSWQELHVKVCQLALALQRHGIAAGDMVAQLSENRCEWIVADLAVQIAGAVHVPLHATLSGEQVAQQIQHCGARLLFVSTVEQFTKLTTVTDRLPQDLAVVAYDETGEASLSSHSVHSLSEFTDGVHLAESESLLQTAITSRTAEDLVTVIYTSGTTGRPKGVMLTQGNLVSNTIATLEAFGFGRADLRLNFLPFSHIFARTCELYTWIAVGSQLALAQNRETLIGDAAAVQPSVMNGVPYFFKKICDFLRSSGMQETPGALAGLLGGKLKLCCSGGAPLGVAEYELFTSQGIELLEGYGLTETSPVITCNTRTAWRGGTVGRSIPGVEVRIADDEEILTRGPHVMRGYLHDESATAETIHDGWLRTGDLGRLDSDGYLTVTGRKKDLIVTATGNNISPAAIEARLGEDPLIEQVMLVGEGQKYLAALIVPAYDAVAQAMPEEHRALCAANDWNQQAAIVELFEQIVTARLSDFAREEQPRRVHLCDQAFTVENGELTPSLKLKRNVVLANYADSIRALYA